jgi:DNA-binding PucR family transcriptional regulator
MVLTVRDPWPSLSPRCEELFREGARIVLDPRAEWVEALHAASLSGERVRAIREDPVLAEGTRRTNLANLLHWASANVQRPGRRVPADLPPEALATARDLVRRGLEPDSLDSYRTAQSVAWRRWMEICFELTSDPAELRELLDVSSLSISTFLDDTIAALSARIDTEREDLTGGTQAERRAAVTLLLEGAPLNHDRAENQLGYRFAGEHTAAIVWGTPDTVSEQLESAAEAVMRASGANRRLTVVASATALWLWLPVAAPTPARLAGAVSAHQNVRVSMGRTGTGPEGFRRSHLDAGIAQQMLAGLDSRRQIATFSDVQLVALLTRDPISAEEFITDTLGSLATADPELRYITSTYIREQCNASRAAERLYTHRNTVLRRLARADELLPRPLADNVVHVAAALELLAWRGAQL